MNGKRKGRGFGITHEDGSVTLMGGRMIDAETKQVRRVRQLSVLDDVYGLGKKRRKK